MKLTLAACGTLPSAGLWYRCSSRRHSTAARECQIQTREHSPVPGRNMTDRPTSRAVSFRVGLPENKRDPNLGAIACPTANTLSPASITGPTSNSIPHRRRSVSPGSGAFAQDPPLPRSVPGPAQRSRHQYPPATDLGATSTRPEASPPARVHQPLPRSQQGTRQGASSGGTLKQHRPRTTVTAYFLHPSQHGPTENVMVPPTPARRTPARIVNTTAVKAHEYPAPPNERKPHELWRPRLTASRAAVYAPAPSHLGEGGGGAPGTRRSKAKGQSSGTHAKSE